jgi:L-fuculose-phosphate aldolase
VCVAGGAPKKDDRLSDGEFGQHGHETAAGEPLYTEERDALVACVRRLAAHGLLSQTAGNVSVRLGQAVLITPTGMEYEVIAASDLVVAALDGTVPTGQREPSSELPLHRAVYAARADVGAVVHTHSRFATTLAILGLPVPAVHYMIGSLRVTQIPLVHYETYGSSALAEMVRGVLVAPGRAALIANHGLVAVGPDLDVAAGGAETAEMVSEFYYRSLAIGKPNILSDEEIRRVMVKFESYGQPD